MSEDLEVPKEGRSHKAQVLIKGGLGGIPIVGGTVGEAFDLIYKSGYEKRLKIWRESVSKKLIEVSASKPLDKLVVNEEFQSLLAESTLIALKNHQKTKLDAVLNLLINSTNSPVKYDFKKLFLNYIDQFTVYHLRSLGMIFENQKKINSKYLLASDQLHLKILNEVFHNDSELKNQVFEELEVIKGLIKIIKTNTKHFNTITLIELTSLGNKFISLIVK